jgi:hypothetical protein
LRERRLFALYMDEFHNIAKGSFEAALAELC